MNVGEDGLNRSTRINTRIKRKLTFLQVSWITRKLKRYLAVGAVARQTGLRAVQIETNGLASVGFC